MRRIISLALLATALGTLPLAAAQFGTHAQVELVPPVVADLAAPVGDQGQTAWSVQSDPAAQWQVHLETRTLDGAVLEVQHREPDQKLATFAGPSTTNAGAPMVMTLVMCRE